MFSDDIETYTNDKGARLTDLVDIFEETTHINDRTFLLNLPPDTLNIIKDSTSVPQNHSFGAALAAVLSDPMKIKFLVRTIQYNSEDTLDFPEKTVILRGATNDATKLSFWYEIIPKDETSNKVLMRESMSTANNLNWISNKEIRIDMGESSLWHENINAIAIEFPMYDGERALYFPFYILMILRAFCNSAEYFYTNKSEETQTLFKSSKYGHVSSQFFSAGKALNTQSTVFESSKYEHGSSQFFSAGKSLNTQSKEVRRSYEATESSMFSDRQEDFITLYFMATKDFLYRISFKEQAVNVISSLIKDICDNDKEQGDGQIQKPSRRNSSDYISIIEAYKKTLCTLGIAPGSFNEISRYISSAKVLDPNVFIITFVTNIPNKTNMFSIPRD